MFYANDDTKDSLSIIETANGHVQIRQMAESKYFFVKHCLEFV